MDCPACHHPNVDGARFCAKCGALIPLQTSNEDPLVGQIVGGRYRIIKLLGEGGMGRIYVGEQQMGTNVRKVAVKTLHPHLSQDAQITARFHRECGTVSELEHPNTIHFFDFGTTNDGQLYIAMEFISGTSLADELTKNGPMAPERVERILGQVCGSLEEAHARGIVHRDLKPDNVILTTRAGQPDFVKVLDFGIAKRSEAKDQAQEQKLTQQGMVLGTPPYMSPEQFTGKELDRRSDIYSLGVMAYEMLSGRLPFQAETPWQWATQHMTAQPFPFEGLPKAASAPAKMKAAIMKALSKDAEQRQASAKQFFEELAEGGGAAHFGASAKAAAADPGRAATAAMSAADFSAGAGGSEGKGGTLVGEPMPFAAGAVPAAPAPVAHPTPVGGQTFPTGPTGGGGGSARKKEGKGLIIGLGAAAGVLGLIGIVVAARSSKPKDDVQVTVPLTAGAMSATPQVVENAPTATATGTPTPTITSTPVNTTTGKTKPAPSASGAKPAGKSPEEACAEARRLAESDNIAGAVRAYTGGCQGSPGGDTIKGIIGRSAATAAGRKILNGDCAGARAIAASASGIGAGAAATAAVDKAPQCKK